MGSSYYPEAYGGGKLDFSGITQAAQGIAGGLTDMWDRQSLQSAVAGAGGDFNKLYQDLLAAGHTREAASVAQMLESQEMAKYRGENLDISRQELALKREQLNKPDPINVPANYEPDPNRPGAVRPIAGGPATKLPQGDAGALAMLRAAEGEWNLARKNGQPLHTALTEPYTMTGQGPLQYEVQQRLRQGDVGRASRVLRTKVEAALRMMTGAAAPQEEVDRYTDFYTPNSTDSQETASQKIRLLDGFVKNAEQFMLRGRDGEMPSPFQEAGATPNAPQAPGAAAARTPDPLNTSPYPETGPQPSANDMAMLKQHANNPQFRAEFEQMYGAGAVDRWLGNEGWTGR
jgi:hypothetical protein